MRFARRASTPFPSRALPFSPSRPSLLWFAPFPSLVRGHFAGRPWSRIERSNGSQSHTVTPRRLSGRLVAFVREEANSSAGARFGLQATGSVEVASNETMWRLGQPSSVARWPCPELTVKKLNELCAFLMRIGSVMCSQGHCSMVLG